MLCGCEAVKMSAKEQKESEAAAEKPRRKKTSMKEIGRQVSARVHSCEQSKITAGSNSHS